MSQFLSLADRQVQIGLLHYRDLSVVSHSDVEHSLSCKADHERHAVNHVAQCWPTHIRMLPVQHGTQHTQCIACCHKHVIGLPSMLEEQIYSLQPYL